MTRTNTPPLFSKHRDFDYIVDLEKKFLTELYKMRKELMVAYSLLPIWTQIGTFVNGSNDGRLNLLAHFDLSDCGPRVNVDRMYLGTRLTPHVRPAERQVTHFIALTKGTSVEVKFHVDLDFNTESDEPKPSPHLQIGGRVKTGNRSISNDYSCRWDEDLDKPRWPSLPFCTALMWHAAFLEFQECESVRCILHQPWWENLVKEAEVDLWGAFADAIKSGITRNTCLINSLYP